MDSTWGFFHSPDDQLARFQAWVSGPPHRGTKMYHLGDQLFNLAPAPTDGQILSGWIFVRKGKPGQWKELKLDSD